MLKIKINITEKMNAILKKLSQLMRYYPNVEKFVLERKKPIIVILTIIFLSIFGVKIWEDISDLWFICTYRANKTWVNAFIISCVIMLLYEIKILITNKNKKEKEKTVTITERIYVLIPFFWIVFAYNLSTLDYTLHFLRFGLSRGDLLDFQYFYLNPAINFYNGLHPLVHYAIFMAEYTSARQRVFSYFVRYQIMQILLLQAVTYCFDHLLTMAIKYSGDGFVEEALFVGFNAYSVFTALMIYALISILRGKETRLPFIDNAIQFHIGARNKGDTIL